MVNLKNPVVKRLNFTVSYIQEGRRLLEEGSFERAEACIQRARKALGQAIFELEKEQLRLELMEIERGIKVINDENQRQHMLEVFNKLVSLVISGRAPNG